MSHKSLTFRRAVCASLAKQGIFINPEMHDCRDIANIVARATGKPIGRNQSAVRYLEPYAQTKPVQVAPARTPTRFQPYRPAPHPRATDIERDQPDLITPCGVGNGIENSPVWTR